ncbi:MAG: hypothetical protein LBP61_03340 [Desulfovibrio sp.]|jgi:hypothetical protein|nr:hypothetical protein [Desulfovibrio sp.]
MFSNIIYRSLDDSYVIDGPCGPYHVQNNEEFHELWTEIAAYAAAHPELVAREPPPAPEEPITKRRMEILFRLTEIDAASIRPLRAIADGSATDFDYNKLATLDAEAAELRDELQMGLAEVTQAG